MKRTVKYVGLDVHQASTSVCVREESGRIIARGVIPTEERALLEFIAGMRGSVHVALEEGTQAQWLYDLLKPRVHRLHVRPERIRELEGTVTYAEETAPKTRERGRASAQSQAGGLIAKGEKNAPRSAKDSYALDNRSHRTAAASGVRSDHCVTSECIRNHE